MKVLIATDGSDCSRHALAEAARLLPLRAAEVAVIAVATLPPVGTDPMSYGAPIPAEGLAVESFLARAREDLKDAIARLEALGVRAESIETQGDPATEILSVAEQIGTDVIVLGSHGRNPLERFLLGSVSDAVAHRFPGNVLIVRPRA